MQRLTSITVLAAMILLAASPVLACMLPEQSMSAAEQACCKHMAGDCAEMSESGNGIAQNMNMNMGTNMDMDMPSSTMDHSCCAKTTPAVQTAAFTAKITNEVRMGTFDTAPSLLSLAALQLKLESQAGFAPRWHLRINGPPPPISVTVSVLRI